MVSKQAIGDFNERLSKMASVENIALGRVYNQEGRLLAIIPNLPGKSGSLKVLNNYSTQDGIDLNSSLEAFGKELRDEAQGDKHPNIQLLQYALDKGNNLRLEVVNTQSPNLLEQITTKNASPSQKFEVLQLLGSGSIRTVEKTYGIYGQSPLWEPQQYAIDALNGGFTLFEMGIFPGMPNYVDKIPLWSQKVTLKEGVKSPYMSEQELIDTGVRLIPGSFARTGAYIGIGTTIMPGGIVNIGAHIAGGGAMIDGGARVASGAQVGMGVKIGAGSGLEGVLEPAGMMPTIIEDGVRIGANCEITGIIGENSLVASGVVMASGKRIYDERTGDFIDPLYVQTAEGVKAIPFIPPNRVAVGGTYTPEGSRIGKDVVVLLEKGADQTSFMNIPKNASLYQR